MKSEKQTDIFGNEKIVHRDDAGRVVGETRMEKDIFGNERAVHYDSQGNVTGKSYVRKPLFGAERIEHEDANGQICGESREEEPLFGEKKLVHRDKNGNVIRESREISPLFGSSYVETTTQSAGHFPQAAAGASSGGAAVGGAAGGIACIIALAVSIALYLAYCFMIDHSLEIIGILRSVVCVGLCPLLSLVCILKNRLPKNASASRRKARNRMLAATAMLFLLLEICFLLYTDPEAEGGAVLAFALFLCCWIPKLIYSVWSGTVARRCGGAKARGICDEIFRFASKAFAIAVCFMELVNVLAGESSKSPFRIIIVLLPAFAILWGVITLLTKLTDAIYRKIAARTAKT